MPVSKKRKKEVNKRKRPRKIFPGVISINNFYLDYNPNIDEFYIHYRFLDSNQPLKNFIVRGKIEPAYISEDGIFIKTSKHAQEIAGNDLMITEMFLSRKHYPNLCDLVEWFINTTGDYLDSGEYNIAKHGALEYDHESKFIKDSQAKYSIKWRNKYLGMTTRYPQ